MNISQISSRVIFVRMGSALVSPCERLKTGCNSQSRRFRISHGLLGSDQITLVSVGNLHRYTISSPLSITSNRTTVWVRRLFLIPVGSCPDILLIQLCSRNGALGALKSQYASTSRIIRECPSLPSTGAKLRKAYHCPS